ncbi:hypothetical protein [Haloarcula nitratireducens]|uniref:Polymerase nucleotidyl transferase domain-containing protein n=1 Tax=Haloarcula nitratireducens TaxID=2487749 RepID=A0AAW4PKE5_9EURY|nr:hypothetical protein [Halomicroarcula nitratireducens]MBX0297770.1 hypothetical protein [Halomicroarcula nitratireducens]
MDDTERIFKLGVTLGLGALLRRILPFSTHSIIKAVSISHLLNFVFNGHLWVFFRHHVQPERINNSYDDFAAWMDRLEHLGKTSDSIAAVAVYGSYSRAQLSDESDLDIRVVRYPGTVNAIVSSSLVCRERARASLSVFPLDIYLLDSPDSLQRLRDDEVPEVLVDKENWIRPERDNCASDGDTAQ